MSTTTAAATVTRLAGTLGARIDGLRLADGWDADTIALLRSALDEHLVIYLPGQGDLTSAQQLEFAHGWGEIAVHPYVPSIEGHEGIMRIYDPNELTTVWHQDVTHMERPPSVSILLARAIPSTGGDTMWSNQYVAYERLSAGLRDTIDRLHAVHEGTSRADDAGLTHAAVTAVHPVVHTHDRTGRKALFVNANYTTRFDGWTAEESTPLLAFLYAAACRNEITWRHRWTVGDLLIWDNRATQHCAVGDAAPGEERTLHRVTIAGGVPA
ncbi:MAG: TauD/TfdA family dioxygenase [Acidimicrobiales bacterium]|nr:TauD/TfdA family dioxygenase [Acidimicrobiales bacterium]